MRALRSMARRLRRAESGAAAVEFALILPVMLLVYIGTVEASALISMDRKVQSVAGSVGDLVARADETITAAQMQDYFTAASGIMAPYPAYEVVQVVTAIAVDADGGTSVKWSREFTGGSYEEGYFVGGTMSEGTRHRTGETYPLPQATIDISKDRMVIAAEASYAYKPLFGLVFDQEINLYRSSFFLPRSGAAIALE